MNHVSCDVCDAIVLEENARITDECTCCYECIQVGLDEHRAEYKAERGRVIREEDGDCGYDLDNPKHPQYRERKISAFENVYGD